MGKTAGGVEQKNPWAVNRHAQRFKTVESRFWEKVSKGPGCWTWLAATFPSGYGVFRFGSEKRAHRVSAILAGMDPGDLLVLHHCDNRRCVRPDHLYIGSHKDNARDRSARNPIKYVPPVLLGERHGRARLTWELVDEIRSSDETAASIARRLGVGKSTVLHVRVGDTWRKS